MSSKPARGLFVTGTDTGVGKTYVAALIARSLVAAGYRVGVYKPAASGCRRHGEALVSDDALALWQAAREPDELDRVCPQRFEAALAPHLAARAEGRCIDARLLRDGFHYWCQRSEIVVVEGAGGLLAPIGDDEYVADLAAEFALPLVVVARNALGTINHTLLTLHVAATYRTPLPVAGLVLNEPRRDPTDSSVSTNRQELECRSSLPIFSELSFEALTFEPFVDWANITGACSTAGSTH